MGLFLTLSQNGTEFSVQLPVSSYSIASVILFYFKSSAFRPDQCGSVGWASFHKVEGHRFDPWSGHMPGFGPQSGHVQEATNQCFSPFLSPSLPLSLKKQINI